MVLVGSGEVNEIYQQMSQNSDLRGEAVSTRIWFLLIKKNILNIKIYCLYIHFFLLNSSYSNN